MILERLLKDRIVAVVGPIDDAAASEVIAKLLLLQSRDSREPASLYVTSQGGAVNASLAIVSVMDELKCPVHTYAIGPSHATAAVIVAHGEGGFRYGLPSSRLSISGCWVKSDSEIQRDEINAMNLLIAGLLAKDTGQTLERIQADMADEIIFKPDEAIEYGLIDEILTS